MNDIPSGAGEAEKQARILQSVLDSMDQGVVVADSQGNVLLCNPSADRIAGVPLSELPLREWVDHLQLFLADGVTPFPPHELPLARALRGEETPDVLMCLQAMRRPEPVYVSIKGRPLRDDQGHAWGGVAVFRDVSHDLKAQQVLRDYAEKIESIYNQAPCGYHSLDAEGTYVLVNDTELSWLGYRREELVGRRRFEEMLTPSSVRIFREQFPAFQQRGWIKDLELELLGKDGGVLDVILNARAVYDERNRFVMSRSTLVDNAERKRAERRISARHSAVRILSESHSLAEAAPRILEAIAGPLGWDCAGLWSVEPRTGVLSLTSAWLAPDMRQTFARPGSEEGLPEAAHEIARRVLALKRRSWFSPLEGPAVGDGEGYSLRCACAVPVHFHGGVLGILALFGRSPREPDELLLGLLEGLAEQFSQFLEAKQMQERVIQSERLASIGVLSAGVAHEINNPLAFVANNLAVLDRDCRLLLDLLSLLGDAPEAVEADVAARIREIAAEHDLDEVRDRLVPLLSSTRQGVERVARTVRDLRGFARLDQAVFDRVNLRDCVSSTVGLTEARLARSGIRLEVRMAEIPPVECAPAQINQVLLNLLNNAIQAIESTGRPDGRIEISAVPREDEVMLEVSDNGCGISSELVGRVFDPFFTTRGVGEGSGLGLSISHGIISEHGGRIELDSSVGQGTRFRVYLPVSRKGSPR